MRDRKLASRHLIEMFWHKSTVMSAPAKPAIVPFLVSFVAFLILAASGPPASAQTLQLTEDFENPETIFSYSSTHSIPYDVQNSEAAHTGTFSLKTSPSTCGASCHDEYRVDLLYTFPQSVRLVAVEFWVKEDSTTGSAWGGKISVGHDDTWNLWWWQAIDNNAPITGEWQHVSVPIDGTAANVRIRIMDITSVSTMWVDDVVIHYDQSLAPQPEVPPRCQGVLVVDGFEGCDAGTWIGGCGDWSTWANGSNGSAFFITNEQSSSGGHALQVSGAGSCWEGSTYKPIAGAHILATAMMRASGEGPIGCHHYQNGFSVHPVATWSFDMPNGQYRGGLSCSANGGESFVAIDGFENAIGQWHAVGIELDYESGMACFWLNDSLVFSTAFNTAVGVESIWMRSGEGRGWFDDVVVCEVSPGACQDEGAGAEGIKWVSTYRGAAGGMVTVRIWGIGLAPDARVLLPGPGGTTIEAQVTSEPGGYLVAAFAFGNATPGEYQLLVINADAREFTALQPFVIEPEALLRVEADIIGRSTVVAGRSYPYIVNVENTGNVDVGTCAILVYVSGHVSVTHNLPPLYPEGESAQEPAPGEDLLLILDVEDLSPGMTRAIPLTLSSGEDYEMGVTVLNIAPIDLAGIRGSGWGATAIASANADCPDNLGEEQYPPVWPYNITDTTNPPPKGYIVIFPNYGGWTSAAVSLGNGWLVHNIPHTVGNEVRNSPMTEYLGDPGFGGIVTDPQPIILRPPDWSPEIALTLQCPDGRMVTIQPGADLGCYEYKNPGQNCVDFVRHAVPGFGRLWVELKDSIWGNPSCLACNLIPATWPEAGIIGVNVPRVSMEFLRAYWLNRLPNCLSESQRHALRDLRWNSASGNPKMDSGVRGIFRTVCARCWEAFRKKIVDAQRSIDPNVKEGPIAHGDARFVSSDGSVPYVIFFENVASAEAAAQEVVITDVFDLNAFDAQSFTLGEIGFGAEVIEVSIGRQEYSTTVDLPGRGISLEINAGLDRAIGSINWRFRSLDPGTGELPEDPSVGFLPPNRQPPEGEGYVMFSVRQKPNLPTGTQIRNKATIVFDVNPPIETREVLNTIDAGDPSSAVLPLPERHTSTEFDVSWTGQDDEGASGVRDYTIYVASDDGPYEVWLANTTETSATFTGGPGRTYKFYSRATDNVGHVEAAPVDPDATTTITATDGQRYSLTVTVTSGEGTVSPSEGTFPEGETVTLTCTPGEGYEACSWNGVDSAEGNTATVTMNADRNVTVEFLELAYSLTVAVISGEGTVTPNGGMFAPGTVVTLTATPAAGYQMGTWTGVDSSDGNIATVTMTSDRVVAVGFVLHEDEVGRPRPNICGACGAGASAAMIMSLCALEFARIRRRWRR